MTVLWQWRRESFLATAYNQQTTFGTNTITYDFNGNLTTVGTGGSAATYTWNVRNQLTGISMTGFFASFTYDSFGRRTGKTVQGVTTNYLYDGLNPVQEKNGATVTAIEQAPKKEVRS